MKGLFFLALITLLSANAFASQFEKPVSTAQARMLAALAEDPDGEDSNTVSLSAGCHYGKTKKGYALTMCETDNGDYLNSPVRERFSALLLSNRTPVFVDAGEYVIGVHYSCTKTPKLKCVLEDLSDYEPQN